jgi:hypothetical protein
VRPWLLHAKARHHAGFVCCHEQLEVPPALDVFHVADQDVIQAARPQAFDDELEMLTLRWDGSVAGR